jgi:transcription initiation factor TFIIB
MNDEEVHVCAAFEMFRKSDRMVLAEKEEVEKEEEELEDMIKIGDVANYVRETCSFCRKTDVVLLVEGNLSCTNCGTVHSQYIDMAPEWRYYGSEDARRGGDLSRCGMPMNELLPNSSFGATISYVYNETSNMRILRRYQMWNAMSYKERSLYNIFDTITTHAAAHGISKNIIQQAKVYYKQISELKISRGDNRTGLIASCIYMACKANNVARSAKEIAKIFNILPTTMTRGCKRFQELLKIDFDESRPHDFAARFCSNLAMNNAQTEACRLLVARVERLGILSHNMPPSVTASCILFEVNRRSWPFSKDDVCAACNVSRATLTKCLKLLEENREELLCLAEEF